MKNGTSVTRKACLYTSTVEVDVLLALLEDLEDSVDEADEQKGVRKAIRMIEEMSFGRVIKKYTARDMVQAFTGGILLSLPMLVEGGVFEIAEWFLEVTVVGVPVLMLLNIAFILVLTYCLIYWSEIHEVKIKKIFGIFPRRILGVLIISFPTVSSLFFLWGRHAAENSQGYGEIFARITVVWATAAIGGALGDILPGESRGEDTNSMLEDMLSEEGER